MFIVKAIYPSGGHIVQWQDGPLRFKTKQEAVDRAEILTATIKEMDARAGRQTNTHYIVVEEGV